MKTLSFMVALLCAVLIHGTSDASQPKTKHRAVRIPTPPTKVNRPSGPVKSAIVVNQRVIQHQNVTNSNTSPPRIVMRHRGSNPAVIGGAATSNAKNTAAISGTRMNRRHY